MSNSDEAVPAEEVTPEPESRSESESELEAGIWSDARAAVAEAAAGAAGTGTGSDDDAVERELDPMKVLAAERDEYLLALQRVQAEFENYRNRIGDLVLLPQGTNQSLGVKAYAEKIEHYLKENLFVKSLHPKTYENNPNFLGMAENLGLKFKAHTSFTKADISERQALIQSICEVIWGQGA